MVSGGALGVDYCAVDEAMKSDPEAKRIKVFLPTTLSEYARHYRRRAKERAITADEAETLIAQLKKLKRANPAVLIENPRNGAVNEAAYFERNTAILDASDSLVAFHVNESPGTRDAIEKARKRGMQVTKFTYTLGTS